MKKRFKIGYFETLYVIIEVEGNEAEAKKNFMKSHNKKNYDILSIKEIKGEQE